jgi:hypothetical protein
LILCAKRFENYSPKHLSLAVMFRMGFTRDDPLVLRRKDLDWGSNPEQCQRWCKQVAVRVMKNESIPLRQRFLLRGQLMMAV